VVTELEAWGTPLAQHPRPSTAASSDSGPPARVADAAAAAAARVPPTGGGAGPGLELWSPVAGSSVERAVVLFEASGVPGGKVSVLMDGEEVAVVDAAAPPPIVLDRDRREAT
jgi:hypothetical protein